METETIEQTPPSSASGWGLLWRILILIVVLMLGWWLSRKVVPRPAVGIIKLEGDIYSFTADYLIAQVEKVREMPQVKAVVFVIDSPGGGVVSTQKIFLAVQSLRAEMPVVGVIGSWAASGGYYSAMAADPIYAMPSSTVGNVGVWGYFPYEYAVNDLVLASGPFKLSATNPEEFSREIEGIKREFLETVTSQRGDRLTMADDEITQGLAYAGREAVMLGLIDAIGTQADAIAEAAAQAKIINYEVIDIEAIIYEEIYGDLYYYQADPWVGAADPVTRERNLPPGIYLLYDVRLGGEK